MNQSLQDLLKQHQEQLPDKDEELRLLEDRIGEFSLSLDGFQAYKAQDFYYMGLVTKVATNILLRKKEAFSLDSLVSLYDIGVWLAENTRTLHSQKPGDAALAELESAFWVYAAYFAKSLSEKSHGASKIEWLTLWLRHAETAALLIESIKPGHPIEVFGIAADAAYELCLSTKGRASREWKAVGIKYYERYLGAAERYPIAWHYLIIINDINN